MAKLRAMWPGVRPLPLQPRPSRSLALLTIKRCIAPKRVGAGGVLGYGDSYVLGGSLLTNAGPCRRCRPTTLLQATGTLTPRLLPLATSSALVPRKVIVVLEELGEAGALGNESAWKQCRARRSHLVRLVLIMLEFASPGSPSRTPQTCPQRQPWPPLPAASWVVHGWSPLWLRPRLSARGRAPGRVCPATTSTG
jgi:hypothetical protein